MIAYAFIPVTFIKVYKRFGDAAARAGETREHFKRAERLFCFNMVAGIVQAYIKGDCQRYQCAGNPV